MAVSPSVDRLVKPAAPRDATPPLVDGDRLTRDEFERRYDAMPGLKKAELIEGVVHMPSPVRYDQHGDPHSCLIGWLWVYRAGTPGVRVGRQQQHPARPGQHAPARRPPDRPAGARRASADQRGRLHRGRPRAGRRGRGQQRQLRPGREAGRLPPQRRPASTSSGASSIARSTGSSSATGNTSGWSRGPTASSAARSSPASGSTRPR